MLSRKDADCCLGSKVKVKKAVMVVTFCCEKCVLLDVFGLVENVSIITGRVEKNLLEFVFSRFFCLFAIITQYTCSAMKN